MLMNLNNRIQLIKKIVEILCFVLIVFFYIGFSIIPQLVLAKGDDNQEDTASVSDAIMLRGVAGLPAEKHIQLAEEGQPLWYKPIDQPQTLREILQIVCGDQEQEVSNILEQKILELNHVETLDVTVPETQVAAVPFCLKVEEKVKVPVLEGDSINRLLKRHYGVTGSITTRQFGEVNAEIFKTSSPEMINARLQPGQEVFLPFASSTQLFIPDHLAESKMINEKNAINRSQQSVEMFTSTHHSKAIELLKVTSEMPTAKKLALQPTIKRIVSTQTGSNNNINSGCNLSDDKYWPFDAFKVASAFNANKANSHNGGETVISIIDTGINSIGNNFFSEDFFKANDGEYPDNQNDDDYNRYYDDYYGVDLANQGNLEAYSNIKDPFHGTMVAAVVLGGPLFRNQFFRQINIPFKLKVGKLNNGTNSDLATPAELSTIINYFVKDVNNSKNHANIINISLKSESDFFPVSKQIESSRDNVLFIFAAGQNDGGGSGRNIGLDPPLYPARYGGINGAHWDNVLTVAAHDFHNRKTSTSNFSRSFVDLLAPGCSIQTIDDKQQLTKQDGTSMAAPLVSFTAGILHSLGIQKPLDIKYRIVSSVDRYPDLEDKAWTGGVLNIVKAISVRQDVIKTSTSETVFGNLTNRTELFSACGDDQFDSDAGKILKMFVSEQKLTYWMKSSYPDEKSLVIYVCDKPNWDASISFSIEQDVHSSPTTYSLSQILDIVPRSL